MPAGACLGGFEAVELPNGDNEVPEAAIAGSAFEHIIRMDPCIYRAVARTCRRCSVCSIPPVPAHSEQLTVMPGHLLLCVPAGQQCPFELRHLGHSKFLPVPPQHWHPPICENDEPILPNPPGVVCQRHAPIDQRAPAGTSELIGRRLRFF